MGLLNGLMRRTFDTASALAKLAFRLNTLAVETAELVWLL
jgi:hypothetical protein